MWSFRNNNQTIRENTFCGHCRQCPSEPFLVRLLQFLENTFHREHILFFWSAPPAAPSSLLVRQASLKFLRMRSLKERVLLYIVRASPRWPGSNFRDQTHTHTHTHTYTHTYTLTIRMLSKCEPKKVVQTLVLGRSCYLQILFRRSSRAVSLLMSPSVGLKP